MNPHHQEHLETLSREQADYVLNGATQFPHSLALIITLGQPKPCGCCYSSLGKSAISLEPRSGLDAQINTLLYGALRQIATYCLTGLPNEDAALAAFGDLTAAAFADALESTLNLPSGDRPEENPPSCPHSS